MRAWVLEKQARIEERPLKLVEVPTPQPQDGEVRVKILVCGVCRTDIHIAEGDLPLRKSPVILGHEIVGIFLYTDGVYNMNAKIKAPGDRNLAEELDAIGARDIPVVGCGVCAKFRGITKADTIEHGKLGGLGALDGYLDRCDRFVTFGG